MAHPSLHLSASLAPSMHPSRNLQSPVSNLHPASGRARERLLVRWAASSGSSAAADQMGLTCALTKSRSSLFPAPHCVQHPASTLDAVGRRQSEMRGLGCVKRHEEGVCVADSPRAGSGPVLRDAMTTPYCRQTAIPEYCCMFGMDSSYYFA